MEQLCSNCRYANYRDDIEPCSKCRNTKSLSDPEYADCPFLWVTAISEDPIDHPRHYADGKIEVIDFIEDKKLGFCLGNAIKYIARAGKKDPTKEVEDLKKALWYIERRIKELEEVSP